MRLMIKDTAYMVHAIERISPKQFVVQPGSGPAFEVEGEVLGDALRARFDSLERLLDQGGLVGTEMVKSEMDEIARHLMKHNI